MQAAVRLGEDRTEDLSAAVIERGYRLHERQRRVHPECAGIQELPQVHGGEQYHVRQVVGIRGAVAVLCALKVTAPSWVLGACTQRVAVGGDSPPGCCLCCIQINNNRPVCLVFFLKIFRRFFPEGSLAPFGTRKTRLRGRSKRASHLCTDRKSVV